MANGSPPTQIWLIRLQQSATLLFFVYVLVLLGRSAWANSQNNQKLADLRTEIETLEEEVARLEYLKVYLATESFRELEARRTLKVKRPGEMVIALPDEPEVADQITESTSDAQERPTTGLLLTAWWKYFFG